MDLAAVTRYFYYNIQLYSARMQLYRETNSEAAKHQQLS